MKHFAPFQKLTSSIRFSINSKGTFAQISKSIYEQTHTHIHIPMAVSFPESLRSIWFQCGGNFPFRSESNWQ